MGWAAVVITAALSLVFHAVYQPLSVNFAYAFYCLFSVVMVVMLALSVRDTDGRGSNPMSPGRVVAVVPAYNETPAMLYRCIESILAGSVVPDEIVVVDDGSAKPIPPYQHELVTWVRQRNQGKRHAQINGLRKIRVLLPRPDGWRAWRQTAFILTVDSDSIVCRDALEGALRALHDPEVQAVTATVSVHNRSQNWLTRLTDLEMVYGCLVTRGARSRLGIVAPTAGTFAVYRAQVLADNVEDYLTSGTAGDDRRLTHYALLRGRVVAERNIYVDTIMPTTLGEMFQQRNRWFKSYFRYLGWELVNLPRVAYLMRLWNLVLVAIFPFLVGWAFVVVPITTGRFYWQALLYWMALTYAQTLPYVTYDARPGISRRDRIVTWLVFTPLLVPLNLLVLRPAMYWAIPKARTTHWQTREAVVTAA